MKNRKVMKSSRNRYEIRLGDRLYASLKLGRRVIAKGLLMRVADFTELIGEVRHAVNGHQGLATLEVRSLTRGWQLTRPLMLYAPLEPSTWREKREYSDGSRESGYGNDRWNGRDVTDGILVNDGRHVNCGFPWEL